MVFSVRSICIVNGCRFMNKHANSPHCDREGCEVMGDRQRSAEILFYFIFF